uniref:Uncharacterized protein n=1 Tax=Rhizophora mucronata TaxID=61149 RepID=A0A2P2J080_RHIMU
MTFDSSSCTKKEKMYLEEPKAMTMGKPWTSEKSFLRHCSLKIPYAVVLIQGKECLRRKTLSVVWICVANTRSRTDNL